MEKADTNKGPTSPEEGSQLNRNRSFKSKQLVRSQAIRESHSPPRTVSPNPTGDTVSTQVSPRGKLSPDTRSEEARQSVEIQITTGACEDSKDDRHNRSRQRPRSDCTNLLSNSPRVACVCVHCSKCRGKRRENPCPIKQDSGIACSDDCPDCTGSDVTVSNIECLKKSPSTSSELDAEHTCRCPEKPKNNISRNDSDDRIDLNGVDLVNFIKATLNKNPKDRQALLKIEKELHSLVTDTGRCVVRFPVMTSYGRMLVHRCATLFQLSHHLDTTTKMQVLVSKIGTSGGRIPCTSFKSWCTVNFPNDGYGRHDDSTQAKSILKRSANSFDETSGASNTACRSKSLEQREKEYERVRRRIFSSDNCTQDESQWPWLSGPVKLLTPESGRNRLLKVHSLETAPGGGGGGPRRGPVAKSHSFGSYGGEDTPAPRLLSRQGDLASSSWRLSPSSSGYKTLSLRSTDSVTPSPTGGVSPEPPALDSGVVWAVTDLAAVPPGALIIHPQTGRPLTNPDGSIYQYDPANPPQIYDNRTAVDDKVDQSNEKRRGRLEKQHSFMDNECECQNEVYRKSCCCDCQKHAGCQQKEPEKVVPEKAEHKTSAPPSPSKNRYEPTNQELPKSQTNQNTPTSTNQNDPFKNVPKNIEYETKSPQYEPIRTQSFEATNQIVPYDPSTNHSAAFEQGTRNQMENRTNRSSPYDVIRSQQFYPTNQRTPLPNLQEENKNIIYAVHTVMQRPGQDATSPPQQINMQQSIPTHDPHSRHLPLVYPSVRYHEYPASYHQVYQPVLEEQKAVPIQDNSFRIDPSYPYANVETFPCPAQCAATCGDPHAVITHPHRSVSVFAPQMEVPQQVYPVTNVLLPQYAMQQYQQLQWQPNIPITPIQQMLPITQTHQKPTTPPNLYLPQEMVYPYGYSYPVYPCYPVYPVSERRDRRTDTPKSEEKGPTERRFERTDSAKSDSTLSRQNSNELALKIQQIKEQMASLSTEREREKERRDRGRRNNGNGILGSHPADAGRPLSDAARAIVNSIRNNYHQDNRRNQEYHNQNQNHHQNQTRENRERPEHRTEYQKNYQRNNSFENRNRYQRFPHRQESEDHTEASKNISEQNRARVEACRNRPPLNVVRQISPGNWCRRSPGPPFTPAYRSRHPPPDPKQRR